MYNKAFHNARECLEDGMKHIKVLSMEYPHRHIGEPDEQKAAYYIIRELRSYGLKADTFQLRVMGWEILSGPELLLVEPEKREIECAPFIYSSSTPPSGLEAVLKYIGPIKIIGMLNWEKYVMIDSRTNERVGYLIGRTDGPAIALPGPFGDFGDLTITWPSCIIGREDNEQIKKWIGQGKRVKVRFFCRTKYKPRTTTAIVQSIVEGAIEPDKSLIICAHYDCQGAKGMPKSFDSPGASDNASGCALLLEIAKYFSKKKTVKTMHFCAFPGEEWGLIGSKEYVRILEEENLLSNVLACVNIDGATASQFAYLGLDVTSAKCEQNPKIDMKVFVQKILNESGIFKSFRVVKNCPPLPPYDHWYFYLKGKPVFSLGTRRTPFYHRCDDMYPQAVNPSLLKSMLNIYIKVIDELQNF